METVESINLSERQDINPQDLDLSDPKVLDSIELSRADYTKGFLSFLAFTALAIFVFFIQIDFNGKSQLPFAIIYNGIQSFLGDFGLVLVAITITGNALASIYGKYIAKEGAIYRFYENDSSIHPILYTLGGIYIIIFTLNSVFGVPAPEIIVGASTGQMVIPPVVYGVACIIIVGACFVPFLTEYGCIDFFGIILEPLMRPLFKTPGKSAVDAVASFVGSASMAVIITSRMFKSNNYTERESSVVATCFSAVSVGYASLMIGTAGLGDQFTKVYFSSFFLAFVIAAVMSRIPPLSRKKDKFYNGRIQTDEDRASESKLEISPRMFKTGIDRAAKKAWISGNPLVRVRESLIGGLAVVPKVITLLCAIGTTSMILVEYTSVFTWLGYIFYPLLELVRVPDALAIAPSIVGGVTDPFIPILMISDKVGVINEAARYFLCLVAMVQIIYVSETAVVIMTTGIRLSFKEIMIVFLERTLVAIPFAAIMMHILY